MANCFENTVCSSVEQRCYAVPLNSPMFISKYQLLEMNRETKRDEHVTFILLVMAPSPQLC